jgi:hypothetical protein
MAVVMESAGKWLEKTLVDLGLDLDRDIISGLVSYCELAQPLDAKEYLLVIPFISYFLLKILELSFWVVYLNRLVLLVIDLFYHHTFRHLFVFLFLSF